ncbi:MAG: hypothetical protein RXO35_01705 [Candidatus Micrarchaeota archaeon]
MSKFVEQFHGKEGNTENAYSVLLRTFDPNEIYVVGSIAGLAYLDSKNNFLKGTVFPDVAHDTSHDHDLDILIKNENLSKLLQLLPFVKESYPLHKITYKWGMLEEIHLPFKNYKLKSNEEIDIFVGSVCAIPANENTYKIEGNVVYKGFSLNAPEKSFIFATYINPLAITEARVNRFFILATDEYAKNGEEQLKVKIADAVYYVALGKLRVDDKKEELKNTDPYNPILSEESFINYSKKFEEELPRIIESRRPKLIRMAKHSGFNEFDTERTATIVINGIREYPEILKDVRRK